MGKHAGGPRLWGRVRAAANPREPMKPLTRRSFAKSATATSLALWPRLAALAQTPPRLGDEARTRILNYLESLAKPGGGYGWDEQPDAFLTVTHAVVGCYRALGAAVPKPAETAAFVRASNPITGPRAQTRRHWTEMKEFVFQQIQTLLWLGAPVDEVLKRQVESWKAPSTYATAYERNGHPVMRQEVQPLLCRQLLRLPCGDLAPSFGSYFDARQRANGTFNTTPAADGSDGHLVNTLFGLQARQALGQPLNGEAAAWLARCQRSDGGFTWCPDPEAGGVSDLGYTWAAVRALALLAAQPADVPACGRWLQSLWNADGGFADRPGAPSSALATLQACETLDALGLTLAPARRPARAEHALPAGLHVYTIQFEAPGEGSVIEAVALARQLRIHLWGAKNSTPQWLDAAQRLADAQQVPVRFFASNEEYGTRVCVPGLGDFTHVNDPAAAPGQPLQTWPRREGTWQAFRDERIAPLLAANGMMLWQICDNEEFARVLLDDSLLRGGYDAISSFHFGCHNMFWALPFMMRYRHEIPVVALQDAHGEAWWWRGMLSGFRTLFLAREPTWKGWLEALRHRRVAAVRRDAHTEGVLRMLGGSTAVRQALLERQTEWEWWSGDGAGLSARPVSVAVLHPEDRFETGYPENGLNVRIRLGQIWAEGRKLTETSPVRCEAAHLGDAPLPVERVERRDPKGLLEDAYALIRLPQPPPSGAVLDLLFTEEAPTGPRTFTRRIDLTERQREAHVQKGSP